MDELVAKFENYRKEGWKKCFFFLLFGGISLGLGLFFFIVPFDKFASYILAIVLGAIGVILLIIGTIRKKKALAELKSKVLLELMSKNYEDVHYDMRQGISRGSFMEPNFFVSPDRYHSSNMFEAKYQTTKFSMSDYKLEKESRSNNSNSYKVYAQGRFFLFDFERDFENVVKVLEKNKFVSGQASNFMTGLKKVELESIEFNKKFQTLSTDQTAAFYILTPQVQEQIMELEKKFSGQIYFCFQKHYLYVAVNDKRTSFKISLFAKITAKDIEQIEKEILFPKVFVDCLKLNREKYNRDSTTKNI